MGKSVEDAATATALSYGLFSQLGYLSVNNDPYTDPKRSVSNPTLYPHLYLSRAPRCTRARIGDGLVGVGFHGCRQPTKSARFQRPLRSRCAHLRRFEPLGMIKNVYIICWLRCFYARRRYGVVLRA